MNYHDSLSAASTACMFLDKDGMGSKLQRHSDLIHPDQVTDVHDTLGDVISYWRIQVRFRNKMRFAHATFPFSFQGRPDDSCWADAHGNEIEMEQENKLGGEQHGPSLVLDTRNDTIMEVSVVVKTLVVKSFGKWGN